MALKASNNTQPSQKIEQERLNDEGQQPLSVKQRNGAERRREDTSAEEEMKRDEEGITEEH